MKFLKLTKTKWNKKIKNKMKLEIVNSKMEMSKKMALKMVIRMILKIKKGVMIKMMMMTTTIMMMNQTVSTMSNF